MNGSYAHLFRLDGIYLMNRVREECGGSPVDDLQVQHVFIYLDSKGTIDCKDNSAGLHMCRGFRCNQVSDCRLNLSGHPWTNKPRRDG
jgi:hypothetical protein